MRSFAFATILAVATAANIDTAFIRHCAKFNKLYSDTDEFKMRKANFAAADEFINEFNASGATSKVGHNQFSDWTHAEYNALLGYSWKPDMPRKAPKQFDESKINGDINWVDAGAVTPVKDQGACGSCWAFGTTGSLEGAHFVATGELLSFSEQQLVDCAGLNYGNYGCYGGLQTYAYAYYEAGHAAMTEDVYPYTSGGGQMTFDCKYDSSETSGVDVSTYTNVATYNEDQMQAALVKQPVTVGIEADQGVFQWYTSGVISSSTCGTNLDHAVLVVGNGNESGMDYWLVKNSWNTSWGDQGYVKLQKDSYAGACGVQIDPQVPTTN